jgi:small-conductance mechanosensitive channel
MRRLIGGGIVVPPVILDRLRGFAAGAALLLVALVVGWALGLLARVLFKITFGRRVEELSRLLGYKQLQQSLRLQSLVTLVGYAVQLVVSILALLLLIAVFYPDSAATLFVDGIAYLPNLLVAVTFVLLGLFGGQVLSDITLTAARAAKRADAAVVSFGVRVGVLLIAFSAALLELGIATVFITMVLAALLTTVALAVGLATGIGGADYVRDVLAGRTVRAQLKPGQRVQFEELSGVVIECGSSATLIALDDGKRTLIPNKLITQKAVVLG